MRGCIHSYIYTCFALHSISYLTLHDIRSHTRHVHMPWNKNKESVEYKAIALVANNGREATTQEKSATSGKHHRNPYGHCTHIVTHTLNGKTDQNHRWKQLAFPNLLTATSNWYSKHCNFMYTPKLRKRNWRKIALTGRLQNVCLETVKMLRDAERRLRFLNTVWVCVLIAYINHHECRQLQNEILLNILWYDTKIFNAMQYNRLQYTTILPLCMIWYDVWFDSIPWCAAYEYDIV